MEPESTKNIDYPDRATTNIFFFQIKPGLFRDRRLNPKFEILNPEQIGIPQILNLFRTWEELRISNLFKISCSEFRISITHYVV
jgi:hypothetical protein